MDVEYTEGGTRRQGGPAGAPEQKVVSESLSKPVSEHQTGSAHSPPASPGLPGWVTFLLVVAIGALLDIYSKGWAFEEVPAPHSPHITVIPGFFYIVHATNTGAMWSLFQGIQREVWIAIRGGVFLILLLLVLRSMPKPLWARLGFSMVLAGALGNLYDNIFFTNGAVRDWLRFDFWDYRFPIFNLADSYICIGAPLLLIYFYRHDERATERAQ